MQAIFTAILTALYIVNSAGAATIPNHIQRSIGPGIVSHQDFLDWIQNTDANVTFVDGGSSLTKRQGSVTVVHCTSRTANVCGGDCKVITGSAQCIDVPGTNCLMATANVGFCDRSGCGGSCNQLSTCGSKMDNNFCATPGTKSVNLPFIG